MRQLLFTILIILSVSVNAQPARKGTVQIKTFVANSIKQNITGEDINRRVTIYLPPGYSASKLSYPVIYFLHGVLSDDAEVMKYMGLQALMDQAITDGRIHPVILVVPNSDTKFRGSFYTNSAATGNWADFIAKDLVKFIDANYRTIPEKNARGLSGHSMGGNGTLKIGMTNAEAFGAIYAMSPAVLNWANEFNPTAPAFKKILAAKTEDDIFKSLKNPENTSFDDFYAVILSNLARTYSPNPSNQLLRGNIPASLSGDSLLLNEKISKEWEANFPFNMIDSHLEALKSFNAIKMDWGRDDEFSHIPATSLQFSKKLEDHKIKHFAEEYNGDHTNKLDGLSGRFFTELLPFFNTYLVKARQKVN
ncbi:MAG: esterase family protein [Gemmatimonadaceae bacterium]|nr:esterase family protein [Chitinophagaceae bacterium]